MKNLILTLFLLGATQLSTFAQSKLGHIDRQELLLALPERKEAENKMQAFAKQLDERLKAMGAEYQAKVAKYQQTSATMTMTEKESAQQEIVELEERIQKAQMKAQDDLSKQEEELLQPMVARTNKAIEEVGAENNFTYIFDISTGFILYFEKGENIMPLVKKKLAL